MTGEEAFIHLKKRGESLHRGETWTGLRYLILSRGFSLFLKWKCKMEEGIKRAFRKEGVLGKCESVSSEELQFHCARLPGKDQVCHSSVSSVDQSKDESSRNFSFAVSAWSVFGPVWCLLMYCQRRCLDVISWKNTSELTTLRYSVLCSSFLCIFIVTAVVLVTLIIKDLRSL